MAVAYSIVVPFFNEAQAVDELYRRITQAMTAVARSYEIIFVNDGSTDATGSHLERLAQADDRITVLDLRRNFGQTAALQAGFDAATGDVIITMDGDLQHDPAEIPLFVQQIDAGYDIASGWRVQRDADGLLSRRLPSLVANWLLAHVSGTPLHDFGTTFKAYRRDALAGVRLYGDMHRYIPAISARLGARVVEVPITNGVRSNGQSHYGLGRTLRVALDLVTLRFLTVYLTRPFHLFGTWGLALGGSGALIFVYGLLWKLVMSAQHGWNEASLFTQHGPLMLVGFLLVAVGLIMVATGLIGEIQMRTYFESSGAKTYAVRRVIHRSAS